MASAPTFNPNAAGRSDAERALQPGDDGRLRARLDLQADHRRGGDGGGRGHLAAPALGRDRAGRGRPLPDQRRSSARPHDQRPRADGPFSSNIATARIADQMGAERMQAAFRALGFDEPPQIELQRARPAALAARLGPGDGDDLGLRPRHRDHPAASRQRLCGAGQWRHLAAGDPAAGRAGPGRAGPPRLFGADQLPDAPAAAADRHPRHRPARPRRRASGSAARPARPRKPGAGGYTRRVNVSTFAAAFPMDEPRYVVLVMMDAPRPDRGQQLRHHRRLDGRAGRLARDLAHRTAARRHPQRQPRHRHFGADAAGRRRRGALMNLGALTGSGETAPVTGFAIDHRKVAPGTVFGAFRGRALQRRGLHPRRGRRRARSRWCRGPRRRSRARSTSPPTSRGAPSPGWRRNSSRPFPRRWSRSPAPTARPRTSS